MGPGTIVHVGGLLEIVRHHYGRSAQRALELNIDVWNRDTVSDLMCHRLIGLLRIDRIGLVLCVVRWAKKSDRLRPDGYDRHLAWGAGLLVVVDVSPTTPGFAVL